MKKTKLGSESFSIKKCHLTEFFLTDNIKTFPGKPHVICQDDGIIFTATTLLPFVGEVFTKDQRDNPK